MKKIVILGAGTAGTMMANKLSAALPERQWQITVVDRDDVHVYQPGLLFVPFQTYREEDIVKPRARLLDRRVDLRLTGIDRIAPDERRVVLMDGESVSYDVLIIATGSRIAPDQTPGLTGPGWRETAFDFYTLEGAAALRAKLDGWGGGRLVVDVVENPIKCPVAPLEFLFLAEAFFTSRGMRDKVEIVFATPLEGAFTRPKASAMFGDLLLRRGIEVVGDFGASEVDGERRVLHAHDGREMPYDLLVTVPLHAGSEAISRSQMGDEGGWLPTDKHTLRAREWEGVFAIGDATDLPSSKAGSVAHFQSAVLFENVMRHIAGRDLEPGFDGHANCFIATGYGKAVMIDFDYTTEPLPGRYPLPRVGPFTLLGESATNHWGKLALKWLYWNVLLEGKELPMLERAARAAADSKRKGESRRERLAKVLGPRKTRVLGAEQASVTEWARREVVDLGPPTAEQETPAHEEAVTVLDGVGYTKGGHLANPAEWTRGLAGTIARALGVELDPGKWRIIEFARADFEAHGASPNVRRITMGTGIATRELYAMFPRAPARTVAKIAGIPKPAGCV